MGIAAPLPRPPLIAPHPKPRPSPWPLCTQELQKCFDVKDVQMLQDAISKMDPTDAKYHMQRCIDSGLWVPNSKSGEAKEGEEAGPGDPLLEAVPKAGNEKDISA